MEGEPAHPSQAGTHFQDIDRRAIDGTCGHRGNVYYFGVHPKHQGNGYGKLLLKTLEIEFLKLKCPKVNILIRNTNVNVREFYNGMGYSDHDSISLGKRLIPDE